MTKPVTSRLRVRVQPKASRSEIAGWHGDAPRVRTTAPSVEGKADLAVVGMLARALNIPRTDVTILRGHGARDKIMEIIGIDEPELLRCLEKLLKPSAPAATHR